VPDLLIIRHGESEWNLERRWQGWLDSQLTRLGLEQARHRAAGLASNGFAPVCVHSSDLGRARRTAEIIAQCLGNTAPLRFDERLREISLGSWDGLDRRDIRSRMGVGFEEFEWYFQTPDGETYDGFAGRIAGWLAEQEGGPVIAVSHGVVTRVLRGLYANLPRAEALRLPVPQDRIFRLGHGSIEEIAA
jgi:probable phosphoglycerate mutase